MTAAAALRTDDEIGQVRGWAEEHLEIAGAGSEYTRVRVAAIFAALDWVSGREVVAPVTGLTLAPTREAVAQESASASARETDLRRQRVPSTFPGVVHETLEWVLGRGVEPI